MQVKVSIIVPVYNAEKYLVQCIDSILNQTFKDFELLLINDGSSDNSGKICEEYAKKDTRIRVYNKENGGVSSARNLGLENVTGEWIAFVDSDDWVEENYLDNFKYPIQQDVDFIACGWLQEGEYGVFKNISTYPKRRMRSLSWIQYRYRPITVWCYFIKANLVSKYKLRFDTDLCMGEDQEFLIRCFVCSDGDVLPSTSNTYNYRHNQLGISKKSKEQILESVDSVQRFAIKTNIDDKILRYWYSSRIATYIAITLRSNNDIVKNDNNLQHTLSMIKFNVNYKVKSIVFLYIHFPKILRKVAYLYFKVK